MSDEYFTLRLRFRVEDRERFERLAREAMERNGGGIAEFLVDDAVDDAFLAAELLLHSNPAIKPYLDYGIEYLGREGR